jgi:hypothetical protein
MRHAAAIGETDVFFCSAYFGNVEGQLITNGQLNPVGGAYKDV